VCLVIELAGRTRQKSAAQPLQLTKGGPTDLSFPRVVLDAAAAGLLLLLLLLFQQQEEVLRCCTAVFMSSVSGT
jgi:hypothetical protein